MYRRGSVRFTKAVLVAGNGGHVKCKDGKVRAGTPSFANSCCAEIVIGPLGLPWDKYGNWRDESGEIPIHKEAPASRGVQGKLTTGTA